MNANDDKNPDYQQTDILELIQIYNFIKPNFQNIYNSNINVQEVLNDNTLVTKFINNGYSKEDAMAIVFSFILYVKKELNGLSE
jgi:hypothetical protein